MFKKLTQGLVAAAISLVVVYGCGDKFADYTREAQEFTLQCKYEKAKFAYEAALELEPESVEAYRGLISIVAALDGINYKLGLRELKQDYENKRFETKGLRNYLLGLISVHEGYYTRAEEYYNKCISENAEEPWFYYSLGRLYQARGKHEDATEIYKKLIKRFPKFTEGYQALLYYYNERGKYDDAISFYEENEELDIPREKAAMFYSTAALAYFKKGEEVKAEDLISKAKAATKKTLGNTATIYGYYVESKQYDKAAAIAQEMISRFPEEPLGYYELGFVEGVRRQNLAIGIENLKKAEELGTDFSFYRGVSASIYSGPAEKYYRECAYDEAIAELEKALEIKPNDGAILESLGFCYLRRAEREGTRRSEDFDKALTYFDRIIKTHENPLAGYNGVAVVYSSKGEYDLAIDTYEKALKLFPENLTLLENMGLSYKWKGDFKKAEEYYLKVLELEPGSSSTLIGLSDLYCLPRNPAADLAKALEYGEKAVGIGNFEDPGAEAYAHAILGQVYVKKGIGAFDLYYYPIKKNYKELAIAEIKKAIELDRSDKRYLDMLNYIKRLPEK